MTKFLLIIVLKATAFDTSSIATSGVFEGLDECLAALKASEIVIPSHNAENEWAGFKTCVPEKSAVIHPKYLRD